MFEDNKYTKCYYNIIRKASNRINVGYVEIHHIVPRSMGGSDEVSNLIKLTAREHFVCHLLLTKMVNGQYRYKAIKAAQMLAIVSGPGQPRYKVTSRIYKFLMEQNLEISNETRERMGLSQKRRFAMTEGTFKNKKHTEETLKKLRKPKTEKQKVNQSQAMKGRFKGRIPHNKGKTFEELYGKEKADEIKLKIKHIGEKNGFYGKTHTEEQRQKKREEKINATRQQCPYCSKIVDPMNYARWHGDKCKRKL